MSKASSPFSSLRGTVHSVSRKNTSASDHSMKCKGTTLRSQERGQAAHMHAAEAVAPSKRYYAQPLQQPMPVPSGHLHPNAYARSIAAGSSVYSQSPEPRLPNGRERSVSRDSSIRVAPLRVSMYGGDGRYLGARSPARQLSRSEQSLDADAGEMQHSISIPVPPKSPRRLSSFGAEQQRTSVASTALPSTYNGMTAEQLRQEVDLLQQFNFEMARQSAESLRRFRPASNTSSDQQPQQI